MLFFNLYIVSQGYPRTFLGELQSMPNLIALLGALPAGVLVDVSAASARCGSWPVGRTWPSWACASPRRPCWLRLSMIFGVAQSLWMVSGAPFMMENSTEEERNALFSANFGLQTLVGLRVRWWAATCPPGLAAC
jgi:hypothetical protein